MSTAEDFVRLIDSLMDQLDLLANDPLTPPDKFFDSVLETLKAITGSETTAVILPGPDQTFFCAAGDGKPFMSDSNALLGLQNAIQSSEPFSQSAPGKYLFRVGSTDSVDAILGVQLSSDAGNEAGRSVIQGVGQLVEQFFKNRQSSSAQKSGETTDNLKQFAAGCLSTYDIRILTKVIANDARIVQKCERVQVFESKGNRLKLAAVSSVAAFEKRTQLLKASAALAAMAQKSGKPIVSSQQQSTKSIQQKVDEYREVSGVPFFAFIPMRSKGTSEHPGKIVAVMVIEYSKMPDFVEFVDAANTVIPYSGLAIANAQQVATIPFYRPLMWAGQRMQFGNFARLLIWFAIPIGLLLATFLIPVPFKVRMPGTLQAQKEEMVFASHQAVVEEVFVVHGQKVKKGQLLVKLRSTELDQNYREAVGEIEKLTKLKAAKQIILNQSTNGGFGENSESTQLASEIADLDFQIRSYEQKKEYAAKQMEELKIHANMDGTVVTWGVQNVLRQKPVNWGDPLLKIADETGGWELRFHAPETKIGYLEEASQDPSQSLNDLEVEYFFQANPDKQFRVSISETAKSTENDPEYGANVKIRCPVSPDQQLKRHGAKVVGDVDCGQRSLFFVWTYELVDTIRRQFVF
ncbi:MAG: biotin/lipoyl-binding protein [Planctomycetota bacterium]